MRRKDNSQVTIAYEHIRDRILAYSLSPGSQISDTSFTKELNMSRAPIREAILLLQMDGLVQLNAEGKLIVSPITVDDISDILHIRCALESESVILIAASGWLTEEQERELKEIHEKMSSFAHPDTSMDHYKYDDLFHKRLTEYSRSTRICEMLERMRLQMQRARWINIASPTRQEIATEEHLAILQAILDHDQDNCIRLLRLHFFNSEQAFRSILKDEQMQRLALMINNFYHYI